MPTLSLPPMTYDELILVMNERPEQVGFMIAREAGGGVFRVTDLRLVEGHRFASQTDDYAEPEDEIRGEMIQWAWQEDACLVEAHSHGRAFVPARFSRFDFSQFDEWVPHVRWRLQGRPYFALVAAGDELDGLAWISDEAEAIDRVAVDGRDDVPLTGESFAYLVSRRGI